MGYPYYKELIFMSLQYLFVIRKLERHKTITPNSGRPSFVLGYYVYSAKVRIMLHKCNYFSYFFTWIPIIWVDNPVQQGLFF